MLWLIWQMWFLLALALGIGVVIGWRIWGASPDADGRSLTAARDEVERLRRENDDLHRSLAMARRDRDDDVVQPVSVSDAPKATEAVVEPVLGEEEDDLQAIKGLGPKAAQALKSGGVVRYSQIAAWTDEDIAQWDTDLGSRGRIVRDDWVGQAKTLSVR